MPQCRDCGKFRRWERGASAAQIYDMVNYGLDHERFRCAPCTMKLGPVESNARPYNGDMSPYQSVCE